MAILLLVVMLAFGHALITIRNIRLNVLDNQELINTLIERRGYHLTIMEENHHMLEEILYLIEKEECP